MRRDGSAESWWNRNWGWVVGCGCLTPILGVAGCAVLVYLGSRSWVGRSGYEEAIALARAHPEVVRELGEPIESSFGGTSSVSIGDGRGTIRTEVRLRGPRGAGRLRFSARKSGGAWELESAEVVVEGRAEPIELVHPAATPGADPPPTGPADPPHDG